jgi:pantoate--beta-alanine ligase
VKIIRYKEELIEYRKDLKGSIGFVPTMGALHQGHVSLIKKAKECEIIIVSIFVNPTQFLANEDFDKYPKQTEQDIKKCQELGVDILFMPNKDDLYVDDEVLIKAPNQKSYVLEGYLRPSHFDGVLQIVLKLFNLVKPNYAYFGRKDAQQLTLIKQMVNNLFLDINIVECDTIRESDGLALSSRNVYLDLTQRNQALKISQALFLAKDMVENEHCLQLYVIHSNMLKVLQGLRVEYIEFVNRKFERIRKIEKNNSIILIAVKIDNTRLIDNLWI